ncbi:MAG TPA: hypothetical protein VI776_12435 [Anaerolineales bacterium]|jgi:hypothetical protein|nr:hypothetical protein [Anaerolineales bacterium]
MDLRLLITPWQRALGAMFWNRLGDTGLVFLYPFAVPRLFHTFFCPPLRLTALSEQGSIIFNRIASPRRFVRLPPSRLILASDPAAALPPLEDLHTLLMLPIGSFSAAWDEYISPDRLVEKVPEQAVADMRRAYEAHQRSEPVRPEVLRARFAPWERGDLCTAAITILDRSGMYSLPRSAVSFSYQILQVEKPHLEELAAASLAGRPWKADFPQECLRCGKPASWRQALKTPAWLAVETVWRFERPENAVPLCKRCAYRLDWSRREGLRIDLAWGYGGRASRPSGCGSWPASKSCSWKTGTGKLTRFGRPSLAAPLGKLEAARRNMPIHALPKESGERGYTWHPWLVPWA